MLREPFSSLIVAFPERRTERVGLLVPNSEKGSYTFARKHNTNSSDRFYETVVLS